MLVVEDDGLIAWVLQRAAASLQVPVHVTQNGAAALETVRSHRCGLAFVDAGLKDTGGLELVPSIRAASPETRIVVMTADASGPHCERALKDGAWRFIEKPFELAEISQLIEDCFAQGSETRTHERRLCRLALRLEILGGDDAPLRRSFEGSALDISAGGLRLRTIYPLVPGQQLRVHVLPSAPPPEGTQREDVARVVWTRREDDAFTAGLAYVR